MLVFNSLCIDWKCIIVTERHWIKNFGNANDFLKATVFIICFHGLFFDTRSPLVKSKTIVQLNLSLHQMHIYMYAYAHQSILHLYGKYLELTMIYTLSCQLLCFNVSYIPAENFVQIFLITANPKKEASKRSLWKWYKY